MVITGDRVSIAMYTAISPACLVDDKLTDRRMYGEPMGDADGVSFESFIEGVSFSTSERSVLSVCGPTHNLPELRENS